MEYTAWEGEREQSALLSVLLPGHGLAFAFGAEAPTLLGFGGESSESYGGQCAGHFLHSVRVLYHAQDGRLDTSWIGARREAFHRVPLALLFHL